MLTDIEIAQASEKKKITEIADSLNIPEEYVELYGNYKAKIDYKLLRDYADKPDGLHRSSDLHSGPWKGFHGGRGRGDRIHTSEGAQRL